jgi:hypothetical protein
VNARADREPAVNATKELPAADFVACTVATVSHLPRARVAAESWSRQHPESPFVLLLVDGQEWPPNSEPFEVVLPEDLGLTRQELGVQEGIYDAYELSCALEPHLIRLLLDRGASAVVLTDTDTCFYAPVVDLAGVAASAGLVLIPTAIRPAPRHGYFEADGPIEYRRLMSGLFNTGLLAVGPAGVDFLDWWSARLARDCLREPRAGMWTDQLWVEWATVCFEHVVYRDNSLNVGTWNLDERDLGETDGGPTVDGRPLRHFHFWGFDPRKPDIHSAYYEQLREYFERERGRVLPPPPTNPVLSGLIRQYADDLLRSGSDELLEHRYGFAVSAGGRLLGLRERAIYREAVLAAEARGAEPPPSPFDQSRVADFERLVDDPASLRSLSTKAQRRLELVRRPGLSRSSFARASGRLLPAARYALSGRSPIDRDITLRVESDVVRLEY